MSWNCARLSVAAMSIAAAVTQSAIAGFRFHDFRFQRFVIAYAPKSNSQNIAEHVGTTRRQSLGEHLGPKG